MTRTFLHSFEPASASPFTSATVDLEVSDIEDAGIREVLQTPGAAYGVWSILDALLAATGAGTPFIFKEPLGQAREVKVALSGLFGRCVARAYLERYFNLSIFAHLGSRTIDLDRRWRVKVARLSRGDLPDWIACAADLSSLTVAEAKGCHDVGGPANALDRAWTQARRINITAQGRKVTVKRVAIATRWGMAAAGPTEAHLSVRDPVDEGEPIDPQERHALFIGLLRLSPEMVTAFLAAQATAGARASTISRKAAAIRYAHRLAGHSLPTDTETVKIVMRGIRRTIGTAPDQKTAATTDRIVDMIAGIPVDTLVGQRDRALLLLGFAGAFRRSELVALTVADLIAVEGGVRVTIRHSKTDQESAGQGIAIPAGGKLRPVEAVQDWLDAAGITERPVIRPIAKGGRLLTGALTAQSVAPVIKVRAKRAGLDPAEYAGHSLRAGFLTTAAEHGANVFKMMEVSRHRSVDTLRGYVRRADLFRDHAAVATALHDDVGVPADQAITRAREAVRAGRDGAGLVESCHY